MAPTVALERSRPVADATVTSVDALVTGPLARRSWRAGLLLLAVLGLGLGLRLVDLDTSPLAFHASRQYRGAVIARSMLLAETRPADDPQRIQAEDAVSVIGALEPSITEWTAAQVWRVTGEDLRVPRLIGIGAWLAGAVAAWGILGRLGSSRTAQVIGTGALLSFPLGVAASRSFQPDGPMVVLALVSVALALRAADTGRRAWWVGAVAAGAMAVLVKPTILPMVVAGLAAVLVSAGGGRALLRPVVLAGGAAIVAPTAAFYALSAASQDSAGGYIGATFIPGMFLEGTFYVLLWHTVDRAVPVALVGLALLGVALLRGRARLVLSALWVGHLATCILVNYRAATHDYYQLPLVALVALSLGLGAESVVARLRASTAVAPRMRRATLAVGAATLVVVALAFALGTNTLEAEVGAGTHETAINQHIGDLTGHHGRVIGFTLGYGVDLAYDGGVTAIDYPGPNDIRLMRSLHQHVPTVAEYARTWHAEWFAVTNMRSWDRLPEVAAELRADHELVAEGADWMLWRLEIR